MHRQLIIIIFLLGHFIILGQTVQNDNSIMEPVKTLFRAMESGDSALLGSAFYKKVSLITVTLDETNQFRNISFEDNLSGFKKSIAVKKKEPYREPIYGIKVHQDGPFAQVWAKYSFYIGNRFHHCGIDTFQLIKTDQGWKIFYLADTRQQKDCIVPRKIRKLYENG